MTSVVFVCWGNICRSPMAEYVAKAYLADAGLDVQVSSAGVSAEERGNPIDSRAARTLRENGYAAGEEHRAHRITAAEIAASDLVIAMEDIHVDRLERIAGASPLPQVSLLSDHDPSAEPGSGVPDPWYGGQDGFSRTLNMIENAMPAVVQQLRELS